MIGAGVLGRLRRRDPGYRISLRAIRLTLAALPAYYVSLYVIGDAVAASYVVFGTVAAGIYFRLPGSPLGRTRTLLVVLPATWALITVGTLLDRNVWGAVAATLVVGFLIAFSGVGGPRLVGLAGGLQLFYIVANFPAHHTHALPARLVGATVGLVLAAAAELLLWPDPTPVPYERRLAEAAEALAALLEACADVVAGRMAADGELERHRDRAVAAIEATRMLGVPRTERPTSASRRDRALRDGAAAAQEISEHIWRFMTRTEARQGRHADVADPMRQCAAGMRGAARTLADGAPPPGTGDEPIAASPRPEPDGARTGAPVDLARLRLVTSLWGLAEHVRIFEVAARVAVGRPVRFGDGGPPGGEGTFWYLRHNQAALYWQQLRVHLTPQSVYFQGALRLAVALAAARLAAAELDLSHGFWALLGTLTVMRTSAVSIRGTLVSAAIGTVIGAIVAGLLLQFAHGTVPFAVEFLVVTPLAFAVGPLLGLAWSQAALTVMITLVFAQLAPTDWSLARVRITDVLVGAGIGVLAGLVMWPRGAAGEARRRFGSCLGVAANLIEETVASLVDRARYRDRPPEMLHAARRELILADASLCLYYLERPDRKMALVHWEAALVAGQHVVHGSELVLRHDPAGVLVCWPEAAQALTDAAHQLREGYREIAGQLPTGRISRPVSTVGGAAIGERVAGIVAASPARPEDSQLVEAADWLINLSDNLGWLQASSGHSPRPRPREAA